MIMEPWEFRTRLTEILGVALMRRSSRTQTNLKETSSRDPDLILQLVDLASRKTTYKPQLPPKTKPISPDYT
jgi:hypothetical protein